MLAYRIKGPHPINRLRSEMDRLFGDVFEGFPGMGLSGAPAQVFPALNVWEDTENLFIEAELPGFKLADIELLVTGDELTLSGERQELDDEKVSYHRRERGTGRFSRGLRLPVDVQSDKVTATLSDGVLRITVPKAEAARPRRIEVKAD